MLLCLFIWSLLYCKFSDSTCSYFLQILKDLSFLNGYFTIHEEFLQKSVDFHFIFQNKLSASFFLN